MSGSDGRNNLLVLTTAPKWWVYWLILELQLAATITQNYIGRLRKTTATYISEDNNNSNNNKVANFVIVDDYVDDNNNNNIGTVISARNRNSKVSSWLLKEGRARGSIVVETNTERTVGEQQRPIRSTRNYEAVVAVKVQHPSSSQRVVTLSTSTEGCCSEVTFPGPMTPHTPPVEALPGLAVLVLVVAVVLATLGLVTCVVSHYRAGGGGLGGRARSWHSEHPPPGPAPTAPMLALQPGMERLSHELRDRQVRLHSVSTDLELDLPPNIALPDGEEIPYGSSTRLQIRDPEQVSSPAVLLGKVKYTKSVFGHLQTGQCSTESLPRHTVRALQAFWPWVVPATGQAAVA
ncbi:uncharacterized protein [Anabrus simplex]|uniref:uncharacterized protein isoform X2 n=1 Tax=Anabrus simplex TaxID=316456 RepID=UPI0035A30EFF